MTKPQELRASELVPCEKCGGPIAPIFARVEVYASLIKPQAVRDVSATYLLTGSLAVAEAMAPSDTVTETHLEVSIVLCRGCMLTHILEPLGDIGTPGPEFAEVAP